MNNQQWTLEMMARKEKKKHDVTSTTVAKAEVVMIFRDECEL